MSISAHLVPLDDVLVGGEATLVAPANAMRIHLIVVNNSTGVGVRCGDKTVHAKRGARLAPSSTRDIQTRGPVYMASEGDPVWISVTDDIR